MSVGSGGDSNIVLEEEWLIFWTFQKYNILCANNNVYMNHSINPCIPKQINQREVSDRISYLTKKGSWIIKILELFCTRRYSQNTLYTWSWKKLESIISFVAIITWFSAKSHLVNNGLRGIQKGLNVILRRDSPRSEYKAWSMTSVVTSFWHRRRERAWDSVRLAV